MDKGIVFNRSYYKTPFLNNYLSSILAIDKYWGEYMFPDDPTRIIYASNDFAFRRRLQLQSVDDTANAFQINSLDMPFFNFAISSGGISSDTDKTLKNSQLEKIGVMDWNLKTKIKATPIKIDFEGTYFSTEEMDIQHLFSKIQWDNAVETTIKPEIQIGDFVFNNYALLTYNNISYNPMYQESDWLEKNRIKTIQLDFSLNTYLLDIDDTQFWIPKKVLLGYAITKHLNIEDLDDYEQILGGVIDHIQGTVTF